MKKLLALLLAALLCASMILACGGSDSSTKATDGNASEGTSQSEEGGSKSITTDKGTYTPENPYKATFMYLQLNELDAAAEEKVHATLNEYLRENYCLEADFLKVSMAEYQSKVQTMLAGGDPLDVFPALFTHASSWYAMDAFTDLTPYLEGEDGQAVKDAIGDWWGAGQVGDIIYGLPACKESANLGGIAMRADICDELGITEKYNLKDPKADDYNGTFYDPEVIHQILLQVHEAYPDMIPTYQSQSGGIVGRFYAGVDTLGGGPGGLDIYANINGTDEEKTKVIDLYDKELCPERYEAYRRAAQWFDEGLINSDAATTTEVNYSMIRAGNTFSWIEPIKVGFLAEKAAAVGMPIYVMYFGYEAGGGTATGNVAYFSTSIAANSEDPDMAWQLVKALYTDPYVMTTWQYGIENENYKLLDDGTAYFVDGEDGANYKYHMTNGWSMGNQMLDPVWNDGTLLPTYWNSLREYNKWAELSPAFGFVFDGSEYATELTALSTVTNKYQSQLENGSVGLANLDATLEAFREELYAAGYQTIIDAKQEQLNAWVAEHGVYKISDEYRKMIDSHSAITE